MRSTLAVVATAAIAGVASGCSTPGNYKVTFYGYPDNSPPGADIAYNCGRGNKAGGKYSSTSLTAMLILTRHLRYRYLQ